MSLNVAITFDIEFSINGAFAEPGKRRPLGRESLICRIEGREGGLEQYSTLWKIWSEGDLLH